MPLETKMVGKSTPVHQHAVDARWIMSYAAGIGDLNPRYMDTSQAAVMAHPVFPVCLEWPVILDSRTLPGYESVTSQESARGVHAAHDLHIYRPITAGDHLTTQATVIGLSAIKPGAAQVTRLDTLDARGEPVCRTYQLSISRGVEVVGTGEEAAGEQPPPLPQRSHADVLDTWPIPVAEGAAHVYTECARIFNPIHTDRAVALAAGLPDIILHGTATLALAVSKLVNLELAGQSQRVFRLGGRFTAMVLMPSTLTLRLLERTPDTLFFDVLTQSGDPALSDGFLCFR